VKMMVGVRVIRTEGGWRTTGPVTTGIVMLGDSITVRGAKSFLLGLEFRDIHSRKGRHGVWLGS
jgi:hypothetical protein